MPANPLLFNCQPDCIAPDWSRFSCLILSGVRDESDNPEETRMTDCQPIDRAEFFTVYAMQPDGDGEPITDCQTALDALAVAATLARLSGLPCHVDTDLAPAVTL